MPRSGLMLLLLLGCTAPQDGIDVEGAEVRIAPAAAVTAAAYFTLHNRGATADTLTALHSDAADSLSLHESMDHGDGAVMMMPLSWLAIPAGASIPFAPGGRHVMIDHFTRPIASGDSVRLSLQFSSGRRVDLVVPVRPVGGEE